MDFQKIIAILLAVAMLLSLAACASEPVETTPSTAPTTPSTTAASVEPDPEPEELYAQAVDALLRNPALLLNVETSRTLAISGEKYVEQSQQVISYSGFGTEDFAVSLQETSDIDGYITSYEEIFLGGTMYTAVDDTYYFKGAITADAYISRIVPVVMLDAALYGEISADGNTLSFASPMAGESWIVPEYAELVEASGTAVLNDNRALTGYTYTVTYAIGGAQITYDITASVETALNIEITPPANESIYMELEYADAPRILVQTAAYLYQADVGHAVTSTLTESIISYAAGIIRNQSTTINSWGARNNYMADVDISVYMMYNGEPTSYDQVEHFQNSTYTFSADGSDPEKNTGVTSQVFQNYCESYLTSNIPGLELLEGATAEDLGSVYYLELTYSDELGNAMNQSICNTLWGDSELLNNLASAYETTALEVYLAIDKYTGLPTAVGYYYEGYHTIDGYDYLLSLQFDQSFDLASQDAYEAIAEEAPPVEEPGVKASPLFYHVTGPDGQEMWLLGTIHVGDARTSYLPQEIYDAFDAADALAVEFNSEAFNDALDEDEELSDQVSACYFYDDSTTQDHIEDAELYEYALKLLKATGNYHMNAPYLKAYAWSNSIDNFYLRQSYDLSSTQGVDNQLIWRAEAQDKPILDVESGLFQIQMLTGFSDGLQELLLLESASTDPLEYISGTRELFEMWCAGDEAALIQYLNDNGDTSELNHQELALVEEYNNAMGTDRNDDMHDVAVGYLESGEVVFFAVGLAHLLAEDGLVNTLRAAGYSVELVPYN